MNTVRVAFLSFAALLFLSTSTYGQLPAPVAFYSLNGNVNDSSSNGFNGTVNGNTNYTAGLFGQQAFSFDGGTTIGTATTDQLGIYSSATPSAAPAPAHSP